MSRGLWKKGTFIICNCGVKKRIRPSRITKFCSRKCYRKSLIGNKFAKGKIAWNKGIKGKASHSYGHKNYNNKEDRKRYAIMGSLALQNKKGYTSIEKKLYEELKRRGLLFEKQYLVNGRFLVDAYIPSLNLIIEADGNYWHTLDKIVKKDKAENAYLKKCGYKLLRLSEEEINNDNFKNYINKWH